MIYSILIKNGLIADGSGGKPYNGDVAISNGVIKQIGIDLGDDAEKIVDASGLIIAPGFIDITNHADVYGTLFFAPMQESMLLQGVTTVLVGNCGQSLAPLFTKNSLNDLERWTTGFSVPIDWTGIDGFYKTVEKMGVGINVATLVGQENLKKNAGNAAESAMLLEVALRDGAWGLSSNFNFTEWTQELESETLGFLKLIKKNNALYKVHMRDEGRDFLPSVATVLNLARVSGARTVISHFKAVGRMAWKDFPVALKMIKIAINDGIDVSFDFFPYMRTGSMLVSFLPSWARRGTREEIINRITDKYEREQILGGLLKMTLHPERIMIASAQHDRSLVGKTLKEVSENTGTLPEELILEILKINQLNVTVFGRTLSQKNLLRSAAFEGSILSSDGAGYNTEYKKYGGLAHPRSFGTYPRFLNVISKRAGLDLGKAIWKMSKYPAEKIGLKNRGFIAKDKTADIVIFSEDIRDNGSYKNPYQYPTGIKYIFLGGKLAVSNGMVVASKNGKVLMKK